MSGAWSNWGRLRQGWSLAIGNAYRGAVVRKYPASSGVEEAWTASINSGFLGDYQNAEEGKKRVEETIIGDMRATMHHWQRFLDDRPTVKRTFALSQTKESN